MSIRDWKGRIHDILQSCKNIQKFVDNLSEEAFYNDDKTIRAVAFELVTIGEAARLIPEDIQQKHKYIS